MARLVHFFIRLTPTYRTHAARLDRELQRVIDDARAASRETGEMLKPSYEAVNTLDMMVDRDSEKDRLPDNEIKDELMTCKCHA